MIEPWEFEMHEMNKKEEWLSRRPYCEACGDHIQQESAVCIRGDYYCDDCLDGMREYIDD